MFGKTSFKNVFTNGMMLDYQGTKMSKSLGNVLSPYEVIDKYSVDIMRNYVCQVSAGENINFNWEDVKVKQRNLMMLDNVSNYLLDLERQDVKKGSKGVEEKWILSKYHSTLKEVSELFEEYRLDEIIGKIEDLYMTLSRGYIKFVRDKSSDNAVVRETLREIYVGILKMLCPIVPFVSEHLWKKVSGEGESIHLNSWDKFDGKKINKKLEDEFGLAMKVIENGLKFRDREGIGLRWPLAKASVLGVEKLSSDVKEIVKRQLNVKSIDLGAGESIEVTLDLKITEELEAEGWAREVARAVQSERKKAGLQKGELVDVTLGVSEKLKDRLNVYEEFLKERVNAKTLNIDDKKGFGKGLEVIKLKSEEIIVKFSSLGRNKR
jgi:valyl-tRNA synthetase